MYFMCRLERRTPEGVWIDVAYLPEKFAVTGMYLQIKNPQGEFVNGWQVMAGKTPGMVGRPASHFAQQRRAASQLV